MNCFAIVDKSNIFRYLEKISTTFSYARWSNVRCGTNLDTKKYFLNTVEESLQTVDMPSYVNINSVTLQLNQEIGSQTNWGFVFIRNLKLWQQYNFKLIDSTYM